MAHLGLSSQQPLCLLSAKAEFSFYLPEQLFFLFSVFLLLPLIYFFLLLADPFAGLPEPMMFIYLPLDLLINVKDYPLPSREVPFDDGGMWKERSRGAFSPPTPLPAPVCFLFYLCNMCFGLGPEQGSAAIIRL